MGLWFLMPWARPPSRCALEDFVFEMQGTTGGGGLCGALVRDVALPEFGWMELDFTMSGLVNEPYICCRHIGACQEPENQSWWVTETCRNCKGPDPWASWGIRCCGSPTSGLVDDQTYWSLSETEIRVGGGCVNCGWRDTAFNPGLVKEDRQGSSLQKDRWRTLLAKILQGLSFSGIVGGDHWQRLALIDRGLARAITPRWRLGAPSIIHTKRQKFSCVSNISSSPGQHAVVFFRVPKSLRRTHIHGGC